MAVTVSEYASSNYWTLIAGTASADADQYDLMFQTPYSTIKLSSNSASAPSGATAVTLTGNIGLGYNITLGSATYTTSLTSVATTFTNKPLLGVRLSVGSLFGTTQNWSILGLK